MSGQKNKRIVEDYLKAAGWVYKRHGNHDIFVNPNSSTTITVPNKIDNQNFACAILKIAGYTQCPLRDNGGKRKRQSAALTPS